MLRNVTSECVSYKRACVLCFYDYQKVAIEQQEDSEAQVDDGITNNDDGDVPRTYKSGDLMSIVDGDGVAIAHGHILDAEPPLDVFNDNDLVSTESCQPNWWLLCKITTLTKNSVELQKDSVFHADGTTMNRTELRCSAMKDFEDGFIIWHAYVVPRMRNTTKASRKNSVVQKPLRKGSHASKRRK